MLDPRRTPAIASDGNDSYPQSMLKTWGKVCQNISGRETSYSKAISLKVEMPPTDKSIIGGRLIASYRVVYGDAGKRSVILLGLNTAYV